MLLDGQFNSSTWGMEVVPFPVSAQVVRSPGLAWLPPVRLREASMPRTG